MDGELRLYTFTNFYLSSIQVGIQSAHLVSELFVKYPNELHNVRSPDHIVHHWARVYRTMICLNGGNNAMLKELYTQLQVACENTNLPFAKFHEDNESMGGMLTCIGAIIPERIFNSAEELREGATEFSVELTYEESHLVSILNSCGLAK